MAIEDTFWTAGATSRIENTLASHIDLSHWADAISTTSAVIRHHTTDTIFDERFNYFATMYEQGSLSTVLQAHYPIEYGFWLVACHRASLSAIPIGYLAWAYNFSGCLQKYISATTHDSQREVFEMIKSSLTKSRDAAMIDALFQMHFGLLHGLGQFPARLFCGWSEGKTVDYIMRTDQNCFAIDCKTKRHGSSASSWQAKLEQQLIENHDVKLFLRERSGLAILRLDVPNIFDPSKIESFKLDLSLALKGQTNGFDTLLSAKIIEVNFTSKAEREALIIQELQRGETSITITPWAYDEETTAFLHHGVAVCVLTRNRDDLFSSQVCKDVTNVLGKTMPDEAATIIAFNLDYLTRMVATEAVASTKVRLDMYDAMIHIREDILSHERHQSVFGVLLWSYDQLQSSSIWKHDIGISRGFWKNPTFKGTALLPREFIPFLISNEKLSRVETS